MKAVSEIIDGVSTNLLFFDNRRSFDEFVSNSSGQSLNSAIRKNELDEQKRDYATNFYGAPAAKSFEELSNHNAFLGQKVYREQKQKIKNLLRKAEKLGQIQEIPNKKLKFNDLGLGVFCFPRAAVALRNHKRPDGTIKKVSDVRDIYAYFPNSDDDRKTISLYQLVAHAAEIDSNQIIYNGIVTGVISEYLVENGYDVEVYAAYGAFYDNENCGSVVKIKSATDEININNLMLLVSDPRYYRTKGFLTIIESFSYFRKRIDSSMGGATVFKNEAKKLIEKHRKTDAFPIVIRSCTSEESVLAEVNRVLGIVSKT